LNAEHAEDADKARNAPVGITAPISWAGISCSLPLGMHQAPRRALLPNNKDNFRVFRSFRVFRATSSVIVASPSGS
jgi:hypothetical protein